MLLSMRNVALVFGLEISRRLNFKNRFRARKVFECFEKCTPVETSHLLPKTFFLVLNRIIIFFYYHLFCSISYVVGKPEVLFHIYGFRITVKYYPNLNWR